MAADRKGKNHRIDATSRSPFSLVDRFQIRAGSSLGSRLEGSKPFLSGSKGSGLVSLMANFIKEKKK